MAKRNIYLLSLFALLLFFSPLGNIRADETEGKEVESYEYKAEVTRLMDIIINYLYTQKDRFMRELVSNSVDALEKARFQSIEDAEMLNVEPNFHIYVSADKEAQTITIKDTGVGMTKTELINNLGTVAKSGTTNFLESVAQAGDINLIGQFGVGFYSAFLVADKVSVYSKNANDDQYIWESSADAKFTIQKDPEGNTLGRGTKIVLHIKNDATEFLDGEVLVNLIQKFSQFMPFPIYVWKQKTIEVDEDTESAAMTDTDNETSTKEEKEGVEDDDEEAKSSDTAGTKKVSKEVFEWEHVNLQKPIWLRPKGEVTDEEYITFYESLVKDGSKPLSWVHFSAEGEIDFKAILFIPDNAPLDMYEGYMTKQTNVKLYARRVLVAESFDEFLPKYLSFVKGVVDSDDIPLNVAREQLQEQKVLKAISKKMTRKVMELIKDMNKESETSKAKMQEDYDAMEEGEDKDKKAAEMKEQTKFEKFWTKFGTLMNLGCYEDQAASSKIAPILQYYSNKSPSKMINLNSYVDKMGEKQTVIYYASGESVKALEKNPLMQVFNDKDLEVIYTVDTMAEACLQKLETFKEKKIVSIQKENVEIPEDEEDKAYFKKVKKMYRPLTKWFSTVLTGKVQKVEVSKSLVKDPCAIVSSAYGYSATMEKSFKVQTFADKNFLETLKGMKVFQINPNHPVMMNLLEKVKNSENASDDKEMTKTASTLYETALISSGFDVDDTEMFSSQIYTLLSQVNGIDINAPMKKVDVSQFEDDETETSDKENVEFNMDNMTNMDEENGETEVPDNFSSIDPDTGLPISDEFAENLEKINMKMNSQNTFPKDEL